MENKEGFVRITGGESSIEEKEPVAMIDGKPKYGSEKIEQIIEVDFVPDAISSVDEFSRINSEYKLNEVLNFVRDERREANRQLCNHSNEIGKQNYAFAASCVLSSLLKIENKILELSIPKS